MKGKMMVAALVGLVLVAGCATDPVIGPFSYMTSQSNEKAAMKRAVARSQAPVEKKEAAIRAVNMGAGPNEVAVGVGVDILAAIENSYTAGEIFKQVLGVVGDLGLYAGVGYGVRELADGDGGSGGGVIINNSGEDNQFNINNGDSGVNERDNNNESTETTSP